MKTTFWLLDVNSMVSDDVAEVWLWGVDVSGRRVLVIDRGFVAYLYALAEDGYDVAKVAERIEEKHYASIATLAVVKRRFFGKPVEVIKVQCRSPDDVSRCVKELREFEGVKDCLEDDIRYSMRYMIDNGVIPCGWHEAEVIEEPNRSGFKVDQVLVTKHPPKSIEKTDVPELRIMAFSTICYGKTGSPKPERDPVVMISVATNSGEARQFVANDTRNDEPVLEAFVNYVQSFDPDIIAGYGTNEHEWPYLIERCKKIRLKLQIDRAKTEPHTSVYSHTSITGRASLDLADYAEEFPQVKVKTLANLADYLGVLKLENRAVIDDVDFADYWTDEKKREALKRFSAENARCIMGVTDYILDFAVQLSHLVGIPLDQVGTAAAGFRVEWFLIRHTYALGELVPKRIEQPYRPYAGGLVLQPRPGLHDNIAALDFKSMYPNLMITYNLSPDTYVAAHEPEPSGGFFEAPEVKHRFRKEPPGFYKNALTSLLSARNDIRAEMKKLGPSSVEHRVLEARQKAVKIITNAAYGYAGWTGARWYVKPVAEAAAAWGRHTIQAAVNMAEQMGLRVIYGDTDSIFVNHDVVKIGQLTKEIKDEMGLEVSPDKVYERIFFTEAKKRYAGLLPDGRLDIVGLEVMRGDWADVAREVQEKVLEIILKGQSPQKAVRYVHEYVSDLRQKRLPYRRLVIWKTLAKPADEYQVKASHVEAARMLREKGWDLTVGDKVGYVVVVGSGRLYERVKPYVFASYGEVDIEYYVSKQVVPAAARVLESFGVTEEQLLRTNSMETKSKKITDFF